MLLEDINQPTCPTCRAPGKLTNGQVVYGHRQFKSKQFWHCARCDTNVGCHPNTTIPMGFMATASTRSARKRAHRVFDALWSGPNATMTRGTAYRTLREVLDLGGDEAHIGLFDIKTCNALIELIPTIEEQAESVMTLKRWRDLEKQAERLFPTKVVDIPSTCVSMVEQEE